MISIRKFMPNLPRQMCQIGVASLAMLISQSGGAEDKSGFMSGARSFVSGDSIERSQAAPNSMGQPSKPAHQDLDDFDDDDDEDFSNGIYGGGNQALPAAPSHYGNTGSDHHSNFGNTGSDHDSNPRTFSAGGAPNNTPDPVFTNQGIALSGTSNPVISKNKAAPIHVDDETAEGSKDIVTDFNFPDADIMDIAKTLGKLTGKNFILDKDVKGKITIISNSPITVSEAWKVFLTALDINQFALIPSGKFLRIARQRDARDKQLKTYTGDFSPDTDALISRVFLLKYISAEEVARTFRSFMPANSRIIPYEQTNTVIVTDTGSNIAKLAKMLEILDVEGYEAGIEVVPVKYASAAELAKLIDALIPGTSTGGGGGPGSPPGGARFGSGSGGRFSARRTKEGGIINTIIPDERTNTLIIHANTKGADQIRELVAKLDQRLPTSTGGGKVHVVYLQFADAEQIANTLNNLSQGSKSPGGSPTGVGGAPSGTGTNPVTQALFEGSIKISPDKATNALVVTASPSDFVTVQRVINKLDIPRLQVYVEAILMEVAITRNFDFSTNVVSVGSKAGLITDPAAITSLFNPTTGPLGSAGALIPFMAGNDTTVTLNGQQTSVPGVLGLIKLLQANSNVNILATPQIIALDNSEALFESSEKIPVQTNTLVQGAGTSTGFQKEPVTLSVKIKPQINKETNFVKLDVTAKYGEVNSANVPPAIADQTFGSSDRTAQTSVVVGDSDTIVLGGLMRERIEESTAKVPILGDIPLLGWLFKKKKSATSKNNLLIFLTPHIIRPYERVRAILDKKLKERDEFLEAFAGGEDPLRHQRDNMIRNLPDIKELSKKSPNAITSLDEDKPATLVTPENPSSNNSAPPFNPEERVPAPEPVQPSSDLANPPPTTDVKTPAVAAPPVVQ